MSNIVTILDMLSKFTQGELGVLAQVLTNIKATANQANTNSNTAVLWSQFSLKKQKNPNPQNLIDPNTGLAIVEPDYQVVGNYPIIFGDPTDTSIPSRSISFIFGAQSFLGYVNDAQGSPYLDINNVGNTATDLSEYEIVNYRTLINAIQGNSVSLSSLYLNKTDDTTPSGSVHTFGLVYLRGGTEKAYYGATETTNAATLLTRELAVQNDITQAITTCQVALSNALGVLPNSSATVSAVFDYYIPLTGGEISGTLLVDNGSTDLKGVVRNLDLNTALLGIKQLPIYTNDYEGAKLKLVNGTPTWAFEYFIIIDGVLSVPSSNPTWFTLNANGTITINIAGYYKLSGTGTATFATKNADNSVGISAIQTYIPTYTDVDNGIISQDSIFAASLGDIITITNSAIYTGTLTETGVTYSAVTTTIAQVST